jgi:hypothetical protein
VRRVRDLLLLIAVMSIVLGLSASSAGLSGARPASEPREGERLFPKIGVFSMAAPRSEPSASHRGRSEERAANQEILPAAQRVHLSPAPTVAGDPQDYLIKMSTMMRRRQNGVSHVDPYRRSLDPAAYVEATAPAADRVARASASAASGR